MVDRDTLIDQIIGALREVHRLPNLQDASDAEWTREVKIALCKIGKCHEYTTCASVPDDHADHGEWLYDVVWLVYSPGEKKVELLQSVPLVAESEWGNEDDIDEDFQKLLLARATIRVMIFGGANEDNDETAKRLVRLVKHFKLGGSDDAYLLAGYESNEEGFRFYRILGDREFHELCKDGCWNLMQA